MSVPFKYIYIFTSIYISNMFIIYIYIFTSIEAKVLQNKKVHLQELYPNLFDKLTNTIAASSLHFLSLLIPLSIFFFLMKILKIISSAVLYPNQDLFLFFKIYYIEFLKTNDNDRIIIINVILLLII